jgi:hypothetical protein
LPENLAPNRPRRTRRTGPASGPAGPQLAAAPDAVSASVSDAASSATSNTSLGAGRRIDLPLEPTADIRTARLRALASAGQLAEMAASDPQRRAALGSDEYAVAWPIVFSRLTWEVETRRGHRACTKSVSSLAPDCLDCFEDSVAAVVEYVLRFADVPIRNLEGWIASHLTAATVDAHRRDRGRRGALQRPRLPGWLDAELGHDQWLARLALSILTWVGIPLTAGNGMWPMDAWARARAQATGEWPHDTGAVEKDVDTVLGAMRTRPQWYAKYVERPLGHKQAPVHTGLTDDGSAVGGPPVLELVPEHERDDVRLTTLARLALNEIARRFAAGLEPADCVAEVVRSVFGEADPAWGLDRPPHADPSGEERISALVRDPAEIRRITAAVIEILEDPDARQVSGVGGSAGSVVGDVGIGVGGVSIGSGTGVDVSTGAGIDIGGGNDEAA